MFGSATLSEEDGLLGRSSETRPAASAYGSVSRVTLLVVMLLEFGVLTAVYSARGGDNPFAAPHSAAARLDAASPPPDTDASSSSRALHRPSPSEPAVRKLRKSTAHPLLARAPAFGDADAHASARRAALAAAGDDAPYCVLPLECAADKSYNWTAAYSFIAPDGYSRLVWSLNGSNAAGAAQGPTVYGARI